MPLFIIAIDYDKPITDHAATKKQKIKQSHNKNCSDTKLQPGREGGRELAGGGKGYGASGSRGRLKAARGSGPEGLSNLSEQTFPPGTPQQRSPSASLINHRSRPAAAAPGRKRERAGRAPRAAGRGRLSPEPPKSCTAPYSSPGPAKRVCSAHHPEMGHSSSSCQVPVPLSRLPLCICGNPELSQGSSSLG